MTRSCHASRRRNPGFAALAALVALVSCSHPGPAAGLRPTVTAAPTAGGLPSGAVGRLAYTTGGRVHVVDVAADGSPRLDRLLGAVDPDAALSWSPDGAVLVWLETAGETARLHEWDAHAGTEAQVAVPTGTLQAHASDAGALTATETEVTRWDARGRALGTSALPGGLGALSLAAAPALLAEVASTSVGDADTGAELQLLRPDGTTARLGSLAAADVAGTPTNPQWSVSAAAAGRAAVVTQAVQDGSCGPGAALHVVDVAAGHDRVVRLPAPGAAGPVQALDVSALPDGGFGAVVAGCAGQGPVPSAYEELRGSSWVLVARGVSVAARGPAGLLAVRRGGVVVQDLAPVPASGSTLVVTAPGGRDHPLGDAGAAVWAPTAG